ncbi:hypothetical protein [Streptomyces sp. NPDC020742]|uniref:hypothetical protein n=1 Tax=Streptomyces sp. NPDC020742 TaxID=3154897 RepID=UPI0033F52214
MQVGALAMGAGMFLLFPAVPWILFPGRRKAGAVSALIWAGVCGTWVLKTLGTEAVGLLVVLILSSLVRAIAEMFGAFAPWREVSAHCATCTDAASCGVSHQSDGIPYTLVAFLAALFFLVVYLAWL